MSLQLEITTIMHNLIKDYYYSYLKDNKLLLIPDNMIKDIVEDYYESQKDYLKKKIREELNKQSTNKFDKLAIENMIFEIFSDKEFAVNKIVRDILNFQNGKIITLHINYVNDLGLKVDINEYGVCISNVIKPSDEFKQITPGDYIIGINENNLSNLENSERINILKNLKQYSNNKLEISVFKNS
jgi:hypothetical protein